MIAKLACILLSFTIMAHADGLASQKHTTQGIKQFKSAYQSWSNSGFWNAGKEFHKATEISPELSVNYYWLGTTRFHRMLLLQGKDDKKSKRAAITEMASALDALETTIKLDPENAEAHAMIGTIFGMKINDSLLRAIRFGPSVQEHHKLALKHGLKNPRVQYLLGAGLLHTAENETDTTEALKSLLLAEKLFESEIEKAKEVGAPWNQPRWGYDACLAFAGHAFENLGKNRKAADYYQKALLIQPINHKAKAGLKRLATTP